MKQLKLLSFSLIKKDIKTYLICPYFYFTGVLFFLISSQQFFVLQNFFIAGAGSSDLSSFFEFIPYISSLFIPILLIQTHRQNPDYYLPFSSLRILVNKTAAFLIIYFIICIPLFFIPLFVNNFGNVDAGIVFAGFTGIFLYAFLAVSFCVFLSELFESKTAFLITSIFFLISLNLIHIIPVYTNLSVFSTFVIKAVSFIWHFDSFCKGILDSREIVYFILTGISFIFLAYLVLESRKGRIFFKGQNKTILIFSFLFILLVLLNNTKYYFRFDLSNDKQFSVSEYTRRNLKEISDNLYITYWRSDELAARYPEVKNVDDYLKMFCNENKNIIFKIKNASKPENIEQLEKMQITSQQIQIINDNRTEYIKVYAAIEIEFKGNKRIIPFVMNTRALEYELESRIENLFNQKLNSIYFICGNKYSPENYQYAQFLMQTSNIEVINLPKDFSQRQLQLDPNIPLFIFGSDRLSLLDVQFIENFIQKGGNAFIAASQYSVDIEGSWQVSKNSNDYLISMLEYWGIHFENALVNDISNVTVNFYSPADSSNPSDSTEYKFINYPMWVRVLPQPNAPQGLTVFWPSKIRSFTQVKNLFYSSSSSWTVSELPAGDSQQTDIYVTNPFYVQKTPIEDPLFTKEQCPLALEINVKQDDQVQPVSSSRLILIPDQYFAHNTMLELAGGETGDFRNLDFLISCALELNNENELKKLVYKGDVNHMLYKIEDSDAFIFMQRIILVFCWIFVPAIYIVLACIYTFNRKRSARNFLNKLVNKDEFNSEKKTD